MYTIFNTVVYLYVRVLLFSDLGRSILCFCTFAVVDFDPSQDFLQPIGDKLMIDLFTMDDLRLGINYCGF